LLIVDSHVHICEPPYTQDKLSIKMADGTIIDLGVSRADMSVDCLLHDMDECNVDRALAVAFSGIVSNEFLSKVVQVNQKRLTGFAWVNNPRSARSVRELEKAVNELGLKGLKLLPSCQGFSLADQEILPLIRRAADFNIPIFIHTCAWPLGYFHHCLVEHIDTLKKRVPKATIIIGHMGYPRFLDLLTVLPYSQPGVFAETSFGLIRIVDLFGINFATRFIRNIGVDNVVFGSDWMGTSSILHEEMNAQLSIITKMSLTKEEKEKILGENIRKILKP